MQTVIPYSTLSGLSFNLKNHYSFAPNIALDNFSYIKMARNPLAALAEVNSTSSEGRDRVWNIHVVPKLKGLAKLASDSNKRFVIIEYHFNTDTTGEPEIVTHGEIGRKFRVTTPIVRKDDPKYLILLVFRYDYKERPKLRVYEVLFSEIIGSNAVVPGAHYIYNFPDKQYFRPFRFSYALQFAFFCGHDHTLLEEALNAGKFVVVNSNYCKKETNIWTTIRKDDYHICLRAHATHPNVIRIVKDILDTTENVLVFQEMFYLEVFPLIIQYRKENGKYSYMGIPSHDNSVVE
jgi:hypothetical protein